MISERTCHCLLCRIELELSADLASSNYAYERLLSSTPNGLRAFASPPILLSHLRASQAGPRSDELLRELFAARPLNSQLVETLVVLAFLPMLHGTVRRVAKLQPRLCFDDVAQQALCLFFQFLHSDELRTRQSHVAFAISRTVKRRMFEWANREGGFNGAERQDKTEILTALAAEEPMERYALLRHFLHRCVTKGLLSDTELELLIQFKPDGNHLDFPVGASDLNSSNAYRQKLKRLLAKLRRLAHNRHAAHEFQTLSAKNILQADKRKPRTCTHEAGRRVQCPR